ncbi:MAG TPA: hypothetical protein VNK26_00110, partial [Pyrinomonadaceae bacterium]|nr:hypothetical protein [Pyrinomonadaceae bacterium]
MRTRPQFINFELFCLAVYLFFALADCSFAQTKKSTVAKKGDKSKFDAVVGDETLSILRKEPSLYSPHLQRMQRGRKVNIIGRKEADGVVFFLVVAEPKLQGWVQSEAVFSTLRAGDDLRFSQLIRALSGYDQIEAAKIFVDFFENSELRPAMLLLLGDLSEEMAEKLSRDAALRLKRPEVPASGAPLYSYYLNFVGLDRFRKLGINFLFDEVSLRFHYNGEAWQEILQKYPKN